MLTLASSPFVTTHIKWRARQACIVDTVLKHRQQHINTNMCALAWTGQHWPALGGQVLEYQQTPWRDGSPLPEASGAPADPDAHPGTSCESLERLVVGAPVQA